MSQKRIRGCEPPAGISLLQDYPPFPHLARTPGLPLSQREIERYQTAITPGKVWLNNFREVLVENVQMLLATNNLIGSDPTLQNYKTTTHSAATL